MKRSQHALVPDEQVDLTRKVMGRIPDPTFVSLFPESHTAAKLLDKAQGMQRNIEGGDGGEREIRLKDYLQPSAGHQIVFLR